MVVSLGLSDCIIIIIKKGSLIHCEKCPYSLADHFTVIVKDCAGYNKRRIVFSFTPQLLSIYFAYIYIFFFNF